MTDAAKQRREGLMKIITDAAEAHGRRMRDDPRYRISFELMRQATQPSHDKPRHYDRDGYCDNPARGY